jgi:hypothetical protein
MQQRRRFKQILTLQDRLAAWSGKVREQADALPPTDRQRDELLKKARQADTASHLEDWANSAGLKPPR